MFAANEPMIAGNYIYIRYLQLRRAVRFCGKPEDQEAVPWEAESVAFLWYRGFESSSSVWVLLLVQYFCLTANSYRNDGQEAVGLCDVILQLEFCLPAAVLLKLLAEADPGNFRVVLFQHGLP